MKTSSSVWKYVSLTIVSSHQGKCGNGEYQSLCVRAQSISVGRRELDYAWGSDCKIFLHLTDSITRAGESVQRRQRVTRAKERHRRKCGGRLRTLSAFLLLRIYQGYWEGDASLEVFSTKINKQIRLPAHMTQTLSKHGLQSRTYAMNV